MLINYARESVIVENEYAIYGIVFIIALWLVLSSPLYIYIADHFVTPCCSVCYIILSQLSNYDFSYYMHLSIVGTQHSSYCLFPFPLITYTYHLSRFLVIFLDVCVLLNCCSPTLWHLFAIIYSS